MAKYRVKRVGNLYYAQKRYLFFIWDTLHFYRPYFLSEQEAFEYIDRYRQSTHDVKEIEIIPYKPLNSQNK